MKLLKSLVLLSALSLSTASLANGDVRAEAEKLLTVVNMEASANAMVDSLLQRELAANPQFKPFEKQVRDYLEKQAGYARLKGDLIDLYSAEFSAAELREISAFYGTPAGRKALSAMPGILSKGAGLAVKRVEANVSELEASVNAEAVRVRDLLKAQGGSHTMEVKPAPASGEAAAADNDKSKAGGEKAGD